MKHWAWGFVIWLAGALPLWAQETVWIQIEAQPSLRAAEDRVRVYAAQLPDVAGFQVSQRWYAVALGPYTRPDAQQQLNRLRGFGQIPRDSFLTESATFRRQFWPIGANDLAAAPLILPDPATPGAQDETAQAETPSAPAPIAPDETLREARASEARLTRDEKRALQTALQWAGFYNAAIDGAYGRGTRRAMTDWQAANGYEETGVLTTLQRAALLQDYNSILDGLGLRQVAEAQAGISIQLPMDVVAFEGYEPPFAHYKPTGDLPVQVALISQDGSRDRFAGLYSVLQTLDLVPTEGDRSLRRDSFVIEGIDATRATRIEMSYASGAMKGFMLVWPAGDEKRRARVLDEMRASLQLLPGTLDPAIAPPDETQEPDLLSGLEIRKPENTTSGFYIDGAGTVLTSASALDSCGRVSIAPDVDADIQLVDAALDLAVLRPRNSLSPLDFARFQALVPRLKDEVAVAGFSYGGELGAPTLTLGAVEDLRGLDGDDRVKRLKLRAQPGDSGGPVLDRSGAVLGLLQTPPASDAQVLPADVRFAADVDTIRAALTQQGIAITEVDTLGVLDPVELSDLARDITVLVQCWAS
ncbi:MAG: trypsin-like peptidase domain-containing protein [Pseudomonadota bacterium]